MKKFLLICFAVLVFGPVNTTVATPMLDQCNQNYSINLTNKTYDWQQEVIVGDLEGLARLETVEVYVYTPGLVNFYVNVGGPWQQDGNDFEALNLNLSLTGWNTIDVSSAGIILGEGTSFVIGVSDLGPAQLGFSNAAGYAPGRLYGNETYSPYLDMAFMTYMERDFFQGDQGDEVVEGNEDIEDVEDVDASVPEPATLFLLGSSLVCLAGFRKKYKKS